MLTKLKNITNTEDKKRLLSNFLSLATLQGVNYILPLITFPYLVRVLGVKYFGLLAFATAIITYFNIITDYGFNLTATREISIYRENKEKVNEIFSSVMIIKFILMIISFILLCILVFSFDKFKTYYEVYFLTFGMVVGQVLFPQWFFQGMEKMKYITFLNILAKIIFTIAIFIFIKSQDDFWKVPLINSLGFIISGIIGLWIIKKEFNITFKLPTINNIITTLKDGWHVFISRVFISGFTNTNTFIIGVFFDNKIVGYYSIAEKLLSIIKSFLGIVSQTLFPYISKLINENKSKALNIIFKKIFKKFIPFLVVILMIGYIVAPYVIALFVQDADLTIKIFRIFLIIPLIMFISMILGQQILLPLRHMKIFLNSLIIMSTIHILLLYPVIKLFGIMGVVWLVVFTESAIMIYRAIGVYNLKKKGLL
jgi:PST family polysaccharide transporter